MEELYVSALHRVETPLFHLTLFPNSDPSVQDVLDSPADPTILRKEGDRRIGFEAKLLFDEIVFLVRAPRYQQLSRTCSELNGLSGVNLIEFASSHNEWMDWRTWLASRGMHDVAFESTAFRRA